MTKRKSKPNNLKITLTMTREEAEAVQVACEWYLRLHLGQFWQLCEDLCMASFYANKIGGAYATKEQEDAAFNESLEHRNAMQSEIEKLYRVHSGPPKLATMMQRPYRAEIVWLTIRNELAWHDHPEGGASVAFYPPLNRSDQPAPKIEWHYEGK